MPTEEVSVRRATLDDAERIALLSGQLGYPATAPEIARRFATLQADPTHVILVAEMESLGVVGWAHGCLVQHLMSPAYVELAGLVVDEKIRCMGVGAALLSEVERWGREMGYAELWVRCNVIRERAHRFYLRAGYQLKKSQHVFVKRLSG